MAHEEPATKGGRPQGQLERALMMLAVGHQKQRQDRHNALSALKSGEWEQQVEVPFTGQAADGWGFTDFPVGWEHPFVYAPMQRNPQFETPHVYSHVEITEDSGQLIIAHVHITGWNQNDQTLFVGATARLALCAPAATAPVACAGVVHLTFESFATPIDQEDL